MCDTARIVLGIKAFFFFRGLLDSALLMLALIHAQGAAHIHLGDFFNSLLSVFFSFSFFFFSKKKKWFLTLEEGFFFHVNVENAISPAIWRKLDDRHRERNCGE